jgi:hypothetical protein
MIYSGIFNSRTGINDTNVFSIGEDITKSADPANGSIQKLYASDTNLNVFQELKVSRALIDKDAIYSAEGGGAVTASNLVIGVLQPYTGEYGISKNPESFAQYGYNIYFADKNKNVILELGRSGLNEISSFGMKNFFRTNLQSIDSSFSEGYVTGGFDIHNKQYVVSLRKNPVNNYDAENYYTLSYDSAYNGWVSLFDYQPEQMFSLRDNFYSINGGKVWEHYRSNSNSNSTVPRSSFYGVNNNSSVSFIVNDNPTVSKSFMTIGYEGSSGWEINNLGMSSDPVGDDFSVSLQEWRQVFDQSAQIPSYYEGEYTVVQSKAIATAASTTTTVVLTGLSGTQGISSGVIIPAGAIVSGEGVDSGTTVVNYDTTTKVLTTNQNLNITINTQLFFNLYVTRSNYNAVFGTPNPSFINKYYSGFNRKENKYVANIVNNSGSRQDEVIFGNSISGIKGFYTNVTMVTDQLTNLGGEKQLFSVSTNYTQNNGY